MVKTSYVTLYAALLHYWNCTTCTQTIHYLLYKIVKCIRPLNVVSGVTYVKIKVKGCGHLNCLNWFFFDHTTYGCFPEVGSTHLEQFLTEPIVIHSITTEYRGFFKELHNVVLCDDDEIFMIGNNNKIRVYNLEGNLLHSLKTRNNTRDLAVTQNDDLVYTD